MWDRVPPGVHGMVGVYTADERARPYLHEWDRDILLLMPSSLLRNRGGFTAPPLLWSILVSSIYGFTYITIKGIFEVSNALEKKDRVGSGNRQSRCSLSSWGEIKGGDVMCVWNTPDVGVLMFSRTMLTHGWKCLTNRCRVYTCLFQLSLWAYMEYVTHFPSIRDPLHNCWRMEILFAEDMLFCSLVTGSSDIHLCLRTNNWSLFSRIMLIQ